MRSFEGEALDREGAKDVRIGPLVVRMLQALLLD